MVCAAALHAQPSSGEAQDGSLHATILALDAEVFGHFNRCEPEAFARYFARDLEFYHDETGLAVGLEPLLNALRNNICGKVRRHLLPGTVRVFRMKGYGAVQTGTHRFSHPGRDDTEAVGEAEFVHLWKQEDGRWKITRVLSFNHHPVAEN